MLTWDVKFRLECRLYDSPGFGLVEGCYFFGVNLSHELLLQRAVNIIGARAHSRRDGTHASCVRRIAVVFKNKGHDIVDLIINY